MREGERHAAIRLGTTATAGPTAFTSSGLERACLAQLLAVLAADSSTVDIRFRTQKRPFNRFGKGISQSNSYNDSTPYSAAGLDGRGQLIGVGDSGIDEGSCYFRSEDGLPVARSSYQSPTFNLTKRKVVQYIDYADDKDRPSGHGTHVCGTLAGSSVEGADQYGGHGSGAKVAFFDMEDSEDPAQGLLYPTPLSAFFEPARLAGAHIHSNSWGGVLNFYDADTSAVDGYMHSHDQFLIVFAAGNDGAEGYYSMGDPACSKNALTVGASLNSPNFEDVAFFSSLGPSFDGRIKPDVVAPGAFIFSAKSAGRCSQHVGQSMCADVLHLQTRIPALPRGWPEPAWPLRVTSALSGVIILHFMFIIVSLCLVCSCGWHCLASETIF